MEPITVTIDLDASIEQVWSALTKPEEFRSWYFHIPAFKPEVGLEFEFYESEESKTYLHRCKILEVVPQKKLVHTWAHPSHSKGSSVVTWTLEPLGEKTRLTLEHSGIENFSDAGPDFSPANFQTGWNAIIKTGLRNKLYGIEKLTFEININAPADRVWQKLWDKDSYQVWTAPFFEGSYYTGELIQGGRIHFLSPKKSGMYSNVEHLVENKIVAFKHIGEVQNLEELPVDDAAEKWTGCFEIYRLKETDENTTKLTVEADVTPEHISFMNTAFKNALNELKRISEN